MKTVSEAFTNKMQETFRSYVPKLSVNGTEVVGDIKDGLTISLGSCGADTFGIGVVFCPSFTASIVNCDTALQNQEIYLEMGLKLDDGTTEYVPMGYFTPDKISVDKYATSFTAYGRLMSKMGGAYDDDGVYPKSVADILTAITAETGINVSLRGFSGTIPLVTKPLFAVSNREAVGIIAGLLGGYATEGSDGNVYICKYSSTATTTVDTSFCYDYPVTHNDAYEVTGIECISGENKYISEGSVNVSFENEYMDEAMFDYCTSNIVGFSYMPSAITMLGDIRLEPFDVLTVTDAESTSYIMPCMNIMHTYDGGIVSQVASVGTTSAEDEAGFQGGLTSAVKSLKLSKLDVDLANVDIANIAQAFIDALETKFTRVGDPAGRHVAIDEDSVDIMDGDSTVASFGENTVIGNSGTGKIQLSDGRIVLGRVNLHDWATPYKSFELASSGFYMETLKAYSSMDMLPNRINTKAYVGAISSLRNNTKNQDLDPSKVSVGHLVKGQPVLFFDDSLGVDAGDEIYIFYGTIKLIVGAKAYFDDAIVFGDVNALEDSSSPQFTRQKFPDTGNTYLNLNRPFRVKSQFNIDDAYVYRDSTYGLRTNVGLYVGGGVTSQNGFFSEGHSTKIGTVVPVTVSSGVSITTTMKSIASVELSTGTWIVFGRVFTNGTITANKYLYCNLHRTSGQNYFQDTNYSTSGGYIRSNLSSVFTISGTEKIHLNARVSTGSDVLSTDSGMYAVRIA